jgi:lipid-binding SYLF domain-containing protein
MMNMHMKNRIRVLITATALAASCVPLTQCASGPVTRMNQENVDSSQLAADSRTALRRLYTANPKARQLGARAKGILVFPEVTKGGVMLGGMGGNGALIRGDGSIRDFYQTGGLSYGLQAGVQRYGYALFLMDDQAFANLNRSGGWEIGSAPSLTVVDQGIAGSLSTSTIDSGTYAFFFDQRGLMGGLGLQGSKITRIQPGR